MPCTSTSTTSRSGCKSVFEKGKMIDTLIYSYSPPDNPKLGGRHAIAMSSTERLTSMDCRSKDDWNDQLKRSKARDKDKYLSITTKHLLAHYKRTGALCDGLHVW